MIKELDTMWKEAAVIEFKILSGICLGRLRKITTNLSQDNQYYIIITKGIRQKFHIRINYVKILQNILLCMRRLERTIN
jgi:hypothetical protein